MRCTPRPESWLRQTRPGGVILATLGSWPNGSGLLRLTVGEDGSGDGEFLGHTSFMQVRAQVPPSVAGELAALAADADRDRRTDLRPSVLHGGGMPAFLAQLTVPGSRVVRANGLGTVLVDAERQSFAQLLPVGEKWRVRQGGPAAPWDEVETRIRAWQAAGRPGIESVRLRVTAEAHAYRIGDRPALQWRHPVS